MESNLKIFIWLTTCKHWCRVNEQKFKEILSKYQKHDRLVTLDTSHKTNSFRTEAGQLLRTWDVCWNVTWWNTFHLPELFLWRGQCKQPEKRWETPKGHVWIPRFRGLQQGVILPLGNIWQYLDTPLIVPLWPLVGKARDAVNHPTLCCTGQLLQQRFSLPQMSTVLGVRILP